MPPTSCRASPQARSSWRVLDSDSFPPLAPAGNDMEGNDTRGAAPPGWSIGWIPSGFRFWVRCSTGGRPGCFEFRELEENRLVARFRRGAASPCSGCRLTSATTDAASACPSAASDRASATSSAPAWSRVDPASISARIQARATALTFSRRAMLPPILLFGESSPGPIAALGLLHDRRRRPDLQASLKAFGTGAFQDASLREVAWGQSEASAPSPSG